MNVLSFEKSFSRGRRLPHMRLGSNTQITLETSKLLIIVSFYRLLGVTFWQQQEIAFNLFAIFAQHIIKYFQTVYHQIDQEFSHFSHLISSERQWDNVYSRGAVASMSKEPWLSIAFVELMFCSVSQTLPLPPWLSS